MPDTYVWSILYTEVPASYKRLHGIIRDDRALSYRGLRGVTRVDRALQGFTGGCKGLHCVTVGYEGLHGIRKDYRKLVL